MLVLANEPAKPKIANARLPDSSVASSYTVKQHDKFDPAHI